MCPLSNVRTQSIASIEEHPIRESFDAGLLVTVNTDDPEMFNNSLEEEYRTLESIHGFTQSEICKLLDNAILGSWLPQPEKEQRRKEFHAHPAWDG